MCPFLKEIKRSFTSHYENNCTRPAAGLIHFNTWINLSFKEEQFILCSWSMTWSIPHIQTRCISAVSPLPKLSVKKQKTKIMLGNKLRIRPKLTQGITKESKKVKNWKTPKLKQKRSKRKWSFTTEHAKKGRNTENTPRWNNKQTVKDKKGAQDLNRRIIRHRGADNSKGGKTLGGELTRTQEAT